MLGVLRFCPARVGLVPEVLLLSAVCAAEEERLAGRPAADTA